MLNRIDDMLERFFGQRTIDVRAVFCIFLIILVASHGRIEEIIGFLVAFFAMAGLVYRRFRDQPLYWLLIGLILAFNLNRSYPYSANHYFVTIYASFMLAVWTFIERKGESPRFNLARSLLMVVFLFATFHKAQSDYFMSGRLLANYFLKGNSLPGTMEKVFPGFENTIRDNYKDVRNDLLDGNIAFVDAVPLDDIPGQFMILCKVFAWIILLTEIAITFVLFHKRMFYSKATPVILLAFLWGTFTFRNEVTFFSLVSILYLMATPRIRPIWLYLFTFSIFFFLGLEISDIKIKF